MGPPPQAWRRAAAGGDAAGYIPTHYGAAYYGYILTMPLLATAVLAKVVMQLAGARERIYALTMTISRIISAGSACAPRLWEHPLQVHPLGNPLAPF